MSPAQSQNPDPERLRREIERTRQELGETVAQLASKADVKSQAREKVEGVKAKLTAKTPDSARGGARQVATGAREHPLPVATAGAFAIGILLGRLLVRRRD
jgi:ElaB/YqjD/DUF883 family membrane-anchored ribosome-binding protein